MTRADTSEGWLNTTIITSIRFIYPDKIAQTRRSIRDYAFAAKGLRLVMFIIIDITVDDFKHRKK